MKRTLTLLLVILITVFIDKSFAQSITYGVGDFNPKPGISGVTYTSSNPAVATVVNNNIHVVGAGQTTITGSKSGVSQSGALTVNKAVLTVKAVSRTIGFVLSKPPLSVTYSGFVNGDGPSNLTVQPVCTTDAPILGPGLHVTTASGGVSSNYTFNYVPGSLYVETPNIYVPYSTPDFDPSPTTPGVTYTTDNPAVATVVNNKIHTTGIGTVNIKGHMGGGAVAVPVNIFAAYVVLNANTAKKRFGDPNPPISYNTIGLKAGESPDMLFGSRSVSTTATTTSAPGAYPITMSFTYKDNNPNRPYIVGTNNGVLNILPTPPAIQYSTRKFAEGDTVKAYRPANTGGAVPARAYRDISYNFYNYSPSPSGMVADGSGSAYFMGGEQVFVISKDLQASGYSNLNPSTGGAKNPCAITVDAYGTFFFGDHFNKRLQRGYRNSTAATIDNNINPSGLAVDGNGNVYVADDIANVIYKITPNLVKTVFAGSGTPGFTNGNGIGASFNKPGAMTVDDNGNFFVCDTGNMAIRKITPSGVVSTFVTGISCRGITIDNNGNFYVTTGNFIKKITPAGVISTLAGRAEAGDFDQSGSPIYFNAPYGIAATVNGDLFVCDRGNGQVKRISITGYDISPALPPGLTFDSVTGTISGMPTIISPSTDYTVTAYNAGGNSSYIVNIKVDTAKFAPNISYNAPYVYTKGIATSVAIPVNTGGIINKAYTISPALPAGLVFDTVTGKISGTPTALSPQTAYTITASNTRGSGSAIIYITVNAKTLAPNITYGAPKTLTKGSPVNPLSPVNTGGAIPPNVYGTVTSPYRIAYIGYYIPEDSYYDTYTSGGALTMDAAGNIYVASEKLHIIQKVSPAGAVSTVAGKLGVTGSSNGNDTATTRFNTPKGIAVDAAGNMYIGDSNNNLVRKITPAGVVSTFAGSGVVGATNATGTAATFKSPSGMAIDGSGNLYVVDAGNFLIRKITPAAVVSTFAGSGVAGSANGTGTGASFNGMGGITIDQNGNLFLCTSTGIRKITSGGVVTTVSAEIGSNLIIDKGGNLYMTTGDNWVEKIAPDGTVAITAGTISADPYEYLHDGVGSGATFRATDGIVIDTAGNLYVSQTGSSYLRRIVVTGYALNTPLPAGLTFDVTSGTISGTPTVVTPSANYSITGYNAAGMSTAIINITVQDSTGTLLALQQFNNPVHTATIYPNPFVETVNINLNNTKIDNVTVTVTHFNGRPMFTKTYQNTGVINVDMTRYEKGIYILNLTQGGKQSAYKIIKN